jgi:hypothetical protein
MADTDKELKLLLTVQANGTEQVTASLKSVEGQATATATKLQQIGSGQWLGSSGQRIIDTNVTAPLTAAATQTDRVKVNLKEMAAQEAAFAASVEAQVVAQKESVVAVEAQAAASSTLGINMGKARAEALVLGRELATGTVNMRTVSALIGSLGTALTFVGLGVFELYQGFKSAEDSSKEAAKAVAKMGEEAAKAAGLFREAEEARSFGDVVKMADETKRQLDKMAIEMATFRATELTNWQKFFDAFGQGLALMGGPLAALLFNSDSYAAELARQKVEYQENYNRALENTGINLIGAANSAAKFSDALEEPSKFLPQYKQDLIDAQAAFDRSLAALAHQPGSKALQDALTAASDKLKTTKDDVEKLDASLKRIDAGNKKFFNSQITADLHDAEAALQGIHQQQQLIQQNPFLSADEKQAQLLNLALREQILLLHEIDVIQKDIDVAKAVGDPAKVAELQQRIQQLNATLNLTKLRTASLALPLQAELANWVNSFGTSAHQVAARDRRHDQRGAAGNESAVARCGVPDRRLAANDHGGRAPDLEHVPHLDRANGATERRCAARHHGNDHGAGHVRRRDHCRACAGGRGHIDFIMGRRGACRRRARDRGDRGDRRRIC